MQTLHRIKVFFVYNMAVLHEDNKNTIKYKEHRSTKHGQ